MTTSAIALVAALLSGATAEACVTFADCNPSFDPCTIVDCVNGECVNTPRDCNDNNGCTVDRCDSFLGCVHDPLCPPNGLVCNPAPHCAVTVFPPHIPLCFQTLPPNCDDGSLCTIDSCVEPTGCQHVPVDCNDGNPCTTDGCDPGTGCTHTRIAGCCSSSDDCMVDRCHARPCQANACTGNPLPVSCDDGNPDTIDGCDPATGCTHTSATATTSTTLPSACRADADCPPEADPCAVPACESGACTERAVTGFDVLGCICRRTDPAACAGESLPGRVKGRRAHACALIAKAAHGGKHAHGLVLRAGHLLSQAHKALSKAKHVSPACVSALGADLGDAQTRAEKVGSER